MTNNDYSKRSIIRQVWGVLRTKRHNQIKLMFILMILVSFAEILSIGTVIPFITALTAPEYLLNINIISTGGTEKYLNEIRIKTEKVEKLTDYPSIFGGS